MDASDKSEDELLGIVSPEKDSDKISKDEAKKTDTSITEENMEDIEEELLGMEALPTSDDTKMSKEVEKRKANKTSETIEDIEEELLLLSSLSDSVKKNDVKESSTVADDSVVKPRDGHKLEPSETSQKEHLMSDDSTAKADVSSIAPESDKVEAEELAEVCPVVEKSQAEVEIFDVHSSTVEKKKKDIEKDKRHASSNSDVEVIDVPETPVGQSKATGTRVKEAFQVNKPKPGVSSADTVIEVIDDDDEEEDLDDEDELEILDDNSESDIYETDDVSEESNSFMDGKICIYSSHGSLLVWNAEDAQMLREECRIVGKLTGCLPRAPRQNVHLGLPLQLMPEEARLLTDIDAAVVVEETETSDKTWKTRERAFKSMREENFKVQQKLYKEERREEIRKRMSEIVAGKKAKKRKIQEAVVKESEAKSDNTESKNSQKEEPKVIPEGSPSPAKGDKPVAVEESSDEDHLTVDDIAVTETHVKHALVQVFTENPWRRSLEPSHDFIFPASDRDCLRYAVFKDLWKKGYCLTSGVKFGGDFLVYPGDPSRFHSHFIAVCMEQHQEIPMLDVISKGRLASNVRKSTILCSLSRKKKVIYTSLQWTGLA